MARKAVLLDTSFFLRFLNDSDTLFKHADDYFRYFIGNNIAMLISTIRLTTLKTVQKKQKERM
jgi:Na+-driven multidrug efflux pump